jgi:hypothetical protein
MLVQQIQEPRRDRGVRAVVEGKSKLQGRRCVADRATKNLRARIERCVTSDGARKRSKGRNADRPGIHASDLFRSAQRLQVNSQLLAFLIEMAAFEPEGAGNIGHVQSVPTNFGQQDFSLEGFGARRECARVGVGR